MYKSFLFLVTILCLSQIIFSQNNDGANKIIHRLVKSELNGEEYSFINSMQELIAFDKEDILKTASKYTDHQDQDVRELAFNILLAVSKKVEEPELKQIYVLKLCDNNYYVSGQKNWYQKLNDFKKQEFNREARAKLKKHILKNYSKEELEEYTDYIFAQREGLVVDNFKSEMKKSGKKRKKVRQLTDSVKNAELDYIRKYIQKQTINKDLILLSGYLEMHDLIPHYKGILADAEVENEQKWYIRLALSRMGVVNEADNILQMVKKVQNGDDFVYHLLPQLIYTRHPLIFNEIIHILLEDKFECTSANIHSGKKINCGYRIIEAFAPVIEDYPYELTITGDLKAENYPEALSEIKDWFTKHKKDYRIKRESF